MKKIKLFTFLILVFGGLFWLLSMYSYPLAITVTLDDIISNDKIRSSLNFSFSYGVENREQSAWTVRNGEVRIGKSDDNISDSSNNEPYYPYSNLTDPLFYDFTEYEISDTLNVDFPVEIEPAGMGTHWIYAYPKEISTKLFNEMKTDLTMPIENNKVVCMVKINDNQEVPTSFSNCMSEDKLLWIREKTERVKIVYAESEDLIYWTLSNTFGLEGENHLYKCEKGRFDKSVEIASWDNKEKDILNIAFENDKIILVCEDRIDQYNEAGNLVKSFAYTSLDGKPVAELKYGELILKYFKYEDFPFFYHLYNDVNIQAVHSIDLDTQIVYDYNLIPIRDMNYKDAVKFKEGRVYFLINEGDAIRIEVYEDYEKIYEGIIHHDNTRVVNGMNYSNVRWG